MGNGQQVKHSRVGLTNAWGAYVEFHGRIRNESGVFTEI